MLTEETLIDFLEGRLTEEERRGVENHLAACDHCLAELVLIHEAVCDPVLSEYASVPPRLKQTVIDQFSPVNHRLRKSWKTAMVDWKKKFSLPAFRYLPRRHFGLASLRGSHAVVDRDFFAIEKSYPDLRVKIEIDRTGANQADIRVKALANRSRAALLRVTLCRGPREVASFLFAHAPATFEDIPFGHYELSFFIDHNMAGRYSFEIKESRDDR